MNIWQSYKQEGGCLVQFLRLLAVWWPGEYDRIIRERWRCGLVSDYFRHLLLLVFSLFYRAMLSVRGTSHEPVSVCLSVRPKRLNESSWFFGM